MSEFQSGKREGYIYGYIFLSGNKGLVLDEGSDEYPIESAELLIDGEFVFMENLTLDLLKRKNLYGSKARIKESFIS
ncbi:hypothetical protein P5815_28045 [Bacillus cereus]|uniref:Uncharacterized protein n=1 Tax=Bacillus thuringiensis serovar yosoo TaxID=180848 RepID=A0A9X6FA13_BACTU|nr:MULTISPECIES: hypothetical protein [Bacillus cereus group]MDA2654278.1 hypothetical protein [Bacillus cereus]MDF9524366.1 hypothetical protein [Bacillus cereus]MDF9563145.1 hypothetical protein [Bacillus cereus]MDZ3953510.1 hypothetical protein [Bacillus thuringiensis]MED1640896.1 hypothetical protein [Bacillus thuringiensis]